MARKKTLNTDKVMADEPKPVTDVAVPPVELAIGPVVDEPSKPTVPEPTVPETKPAVQETKPAMKQPAKKMASLPKPAKKRVRDRKKQDKKLSVAVLCTNPMTRRFI